MFASSQTGNIVRSPPPFPFELLELNRVLVAVEFPHPDISKARVDILVENKMGNVWRFLRPVCFFLLDPQVDF